MRSQRTLVGIGLVLATVTLAAILETPRDIGAAEDVCVEAFTEGLEGAPAGVTVARDGRFWMVEQFESRIATFDPESGDAREFQLEGEPHPHAITEAPDGKLWWVAPGGFYGSFDPRTRATASFGQKLPPMSAPHSIVAAGDSLYVSLQEAGQIVRIDPDDGSSEAIDANLSPISRPHGLTVDPDGRHLWVALQNADEIVRIDLRSERVDARAKFSDASGPYEIAIGPDDRLYVTLQYGSRLGRFDLRSEAVEEFEMPVPVPRRGNDLVPGPKLTDLEVSADGEAIWMATFALGPLLRFDLDEERVTRTTCGLVEGGATYEFVKDSDGEIWVTQPIGHAIGRIEE